MNDRIRKKRESKIRTRCLCCGNYALIGTDTAYDICPVCFWENDVPEDESKFSGANNMTLGQGRANYLAFGACDEKMLPHTRPPRREELPENNQKRGR